MIYISDGHIIGFAKRRLVRMLGKKKDDRGSKT